MWAAALCCLSYLGYNYNGCFGCCGPRIFLPNPPDKPSDDGFPRSILCGGFGRPLARALSPCQHDGLSACTHACEPMRALRSNHGCFISINLPRPAVPLTENFC